MPEISTHEQAVNVFYLIKDDANAIIEIKEEARKLAKETALNPRAGFEITSATVNGETFSGVMVQSKIKRLDMLTRLVIMLDKLQANSNFIPSNKTTPEF